MSQVPPKSEERTRSPSRSSNLYPQSSAVLATDFCTEDAGDSDSDRNADVGHDFEYTPAGAPTLYTRGSSKANTASFSGSPEKHQKSNLPDVAVSTKPQVQTTGVHWGSQTRITVTAEPDPRVLKVELYSYETKAQAGILVNLSNICSSTEERSVRRTYIEQYMTNEFSCNYWTLTAELRNEIAKCCNLLCDSRET